MNYISNIDTICILVDIENYEEISKMIIEYLSKEKEKAKSYAKINVTYKHLINISNMNFYLSTSGTKGYAYILVNEGFQVNISEFKSKIDNFLPIQVRISSEYLWAYGLSNSWSIIYNWLVETFGNISREKVFRLDLCSHISGVDFITNYEQIYKGNFKKREIFYTANEINSITFGSRKSKNIYCRIYNKTLEINEKKHKLWFNEIWEYNGLDVNNVWNIEFEIKSEFLRASNINTINDVLQHLGAIWKYCTTHWLVKVDRVNSRIERCPINSDWQNIQNNYNSFQSRGLIQLEKQNISNANALIPNIIGNITSYSAKINTFNINEVFSKLHSQAIRYLNKKNTTFESEVNRKKSILIRKEVKHNE